MFFFCLNNPGAKMHTPPSIKKEIIPCELPLSNLKVLREHDNQYPILPVNTKRPAGKQKKTAAETCVFYISLQLLKILFFKGNI